MNVLYIHTHDTGRMLSPYGYNTPTNNILELAKDGVVFRQAYSAAPTCSPSRAALLTGVYPHNNGMLGLAHRGFKLKEYNQHLANYLAINGYETVLCGVQHEDSLWTHNSEVFKNLGYCKNITCNCDGIAQEDMVHWDLQNAYAAVKYIRERNKTKKFFLSFGMFATHRKYPLKEQNAVDERYIALPYSTFDNKKNREDTARFYTSLKYADTCMGIVIEALKKTGTYDDTLIIFTTDHGIANPFNKCSLFDSGIGVSLIIRDPNSIKQGIVIDAMVSQLDIFPTICDLLKIKKPYWLQGVSLVPLLENKTDKVRDEVFAEINYHTSYEPARCIRTKRFKLIRYYDYYEGINYSNIDDSDPKDFLMRNGLSDVRKPKEALYDLYLDPYEKNNLINLQQYKEIAHEMRSKLYKWQEDTDDPLLHGEILAPYAKKINKRECISPGSTYKEDYDIYLE